MQFVARYPNLSTLLIAVAIDAVAIAILIAAMPPRF
jgi:hypothetical protein